VKTAYAGAGLALMAGLLMGAAMKPELGADDRPAGPQIVAGSAGARAAGPFEDDAPTFAAYSGKIPDYVLGSDWTRLAAAPAVAPPARGEVEAPAPTEDAEAPAPLAHDAEFHATPAVATERVAYNPPADAIEDEAPPEATGDTSPAPNS